MPWPAPAQVAVRDPSIDTLPRPGYEPRTIRLGDLTIAPSITLAATATDNVFALDRGGRGDTIVMVMPDVTARYRSPRLDLTASGFANLYRYARYDAEDVDEYGAGVEGTRSFGARHAFTLRARYDRTFERRSDPEADLGRARPPALIDIFDGGVDYRYKGGRIAVAGGIGASKLDYLPVADSDRDLVTYRGSLRVTFAATRRMGVFVQGYANRRDTRLTTDRGGVDRRTTTVGVMTGVSFDIADRLQGDVGGGILREDPQDIGLPPYTGFAFNGRLLWRPRVRTAVVLDGFRGDVATVRIGAIGRIDTRFAISIEQEVRHNLLLRVAGGIRHIRFRGDFDQNQRYRTGEVEIRYLVDRHVSIVADVAHTRRDTETDYGRFRRWQGMAGLRFAY